MTEQNVIGLSESFQCAKHRGGSCFDTEFDVDIFDVFLHRARTDAAQQTDHGIGFTLRDSEQNFRFARRDLQTIKHFRRAERLFFEQNDFLAGRAVVH